jgi:hypothetical protein
MGRSVSYLNNSVFVLYFPFDYSENPEDDNMNWDDMIENLKYEIKAKLPSYHKTDEWDNRETRIILKNNLCNIGISEYCGLVSLSVAPKNNEYDVWHESFALRHAQQIKGTLEKVLNDLGLKRLSKIGTFSNGESIFELAK